MIASADDSEMLWVEKMLYLPMIDHSLNVLHCNDIINQPKDYPSTQTIGMHNKSRVTVEVLTNWEWILCCYKNWPNKYKNCRVSPSQNHCNPTLPARISLSTMYNKARVWKETCAILQLWKHLHGGWDWICLVLQGHPLYHFHSPPQHPKQLEKYHAEKSVCCCGWGWKASK